MFSRVRAHVCLSVYMECRSYTWIAYFFSFSFRVTYLTGSFFIRLGVSVRNLSVFPTTGPVLRLQECTTILVFDMDSGLPDLGLHACIEGAFLVEPSSEPSSLLFELEHGLS